MTIANTLTDLQGQIYSAVDIVSRELVGLTSLVSINGEATRAQVGQTVSIPVSQPKTSQDITPAMTPPEPSNISVPSRTMSITRAKQVPWGFTGEEQLGLNNGFGFMSVQTREIAQALRTLTNYVESDLASLYYKFSRAYGTAGTTPFASDLTDTAYPLKILEDNGAPVGGGWGLGVDTAAMAKLRSLGQLTKVNEAGDDTMLRQGTITDIHGGRIKGSGQIKTHTKGTASGATTDATGYAVGSTTITLASAGTGTILAGDVVTFAGDTNKYLVTTGDSDVSNGGTIVLAEPGLRVAIPASATAITVGNSYTANMAFTPDAIQLAARMPAMPEGGDAAAEVMTVIDPRSGLVYEFTMYKGFRQNVYFVSLAWGYEVTKPEHTAILLG